LEFFLLLKGGELEKINKLNMILKKKTAAEFAAILKEEGREQEGMDLLIKNPCFFCYLGNATGKYCSGSKYCVWQDEDSIWVPEKVKVRRKK
jgi:hypothetical protein